MAFNSENEGGVTDTNVNPIDPGAISNVNTVKLDEAVNLELENLARIQDRANQVHNVWAGSYLPCELQTLALVEARQKETVDQVAQAVAGFASLDQAYANTYAAPAEMMTELCIVDKCGPNNRINIALARSKSWHAQANMRHEEIRVRDSNAQRINDRIAMIAPGRGGVAQAMNALQAAQKLLEGTAAQAEAAKGANAYALGRILEFAKGNLGNLGKLAQSFAPLPQAEAGYQDMFQRSDQSANILGDTYQLSYDAGAEAGYDSFGMMPAMPADTGSGVTFDTSAGTSFDVGTINGFN